MWPPLFVGTLIGAMAIVSETTWLATYGLRPAGRDLDKVRACLLSETEKEEQAQGRGDTERMRLCCVQLFLVGTLADVFLIWRAKRASMDAAVSIDVQLLCGRGLTETKRFLASSTHPLAAGILARIIEGESGVYADFAEFSVERWARQHERYYGLSSVDSTP